MDQAAANALTCLDLIRLQAERQPEAAALLAPGSFALTYRALIDEIEGSARRLRAMGIASSGRVALVLPNGPQAALGFIAVSSACACAPLNPGYQAREFEFYLSDLKAGLLLTDNPAGAAGQAARGLGIEVAPLEAITGGSAGGEAGFSSADDVALLLHTSGTTARPKLVPLLHRNLCASARNISRTLALTPADRCLNIMPLFHIHGLIAAVLSTLCSGGSVVCTDGLYGTHFYDWLGEFRPTWYTAVPTMHAAIVSRAAGNREAIAAHPLRLIRSSSAPLPPQVLASLEDAFHTPVLESYGMTEAAHQMASNPLPPAVRKPGSVGLPAGPDIAILTESGAFATNGDKGEVVIRGDNVTPGYENNPEANATAFVNGWFRTGDLGYLDSDGYLVLAGRLKELINRGGEKISPREIDEILLDHPAIQQALAFAVPHAQLGEEVGVAIVLKEGASLDEIQVREYAASRLAPFKTPRIVKILNEIPKGPTGKPQRVGLASKLGIGTMDGAASASAYVEPRDSVEDSLSRLWQDLLRVPRAGAFDTFASLGGDSLQAARMIAAVSEQFGVDVPFGRFLDEGTIASLAEEIKAARARDAEQSELIAIQKGGNRAPLFCVAAHDGVLLGFAQLGRLLGADVPVWGLRPPRQDHTIADLTIERLAAGYAGELRRSNSGPFHLIGVCFGGIVVYEVARQLRAAGEEIASLIMVDSVNPAWEKQLSAAEKLRLTAGLYWDRMKVHAATLRSSEVNGRAYLASRLQVFFRHRREEAELRQAKSGGNAALLQRRQNATRLAARVYNPLPYDGKALLLRVHSRRLDGPLLGWRGVMRGPVEMHDLPFSELGVLAEPTIRLLAERVAAALVK